MKSYQITHKHGFVGTGATDISVALSVTFLVAYVVLSNLVF